MTKYIIKRVLLMFLTLLIITTTCFVLIKLLPLPAIREMGRDVNLILAKREAMGYNKPIMVQFYLFMKNILLHWDWGVGEQMYEALSVWDVMMQKLPYTVLVNLYSILFAIPLGLCFGIYAALKKNRWQDHVISTMVIVFISVPSVFEGGRFVLMPYTTWDISQPQNISFQYLLFDKRTGECLKIENDAIVNDMVGNLPFRPVARVADNVLMAWLDVSYLQEQMEKGIQLPVGLKRMKDDDNAVLMLVYLKKE